VVTDPVVSVLVADSDPEHDGDDRVDDDSRPETQRRNRAVEAPYRELVTGRTPGRCRPTRARNASVAVNV
jgi:hypothetical protein